MRLRALTIDLSHFWKWAGQGAGEMDPKRALFSVCGFGTIGVGDRVWEGIYHIAKMEMVDIRDG